MSGTEIRKFRDGVLAKITNEIAAPMNGAVANKAPALDEPISFKVKINKMRLIP